MGACAWVMYPRTQSPPAHPIPHLALGSSTSTTTRLDRRRAHPGTTGTYLGQRGTEVHGPSHPYHGRPGWLRHRHVSLVVAHGHLGSIFVSFLAPSNHGPAGIMRLQRYKRPRYLWPSYLGAHPPTHC